MHADLPLILISGAPNSNDHASDRVLHHTIGETDRRQALEVYRHVVADAGERTGLAQQRRRQLSPFPFTHAHLPPVEIRSPAQAAAQIDRALVAAVTRRKPVYLEIAW